jgi:hypothetical protein
MSEEEIIKYLKKRIEQSKYDFENFGEHNFLDISTINAIQGLLDLYNKQKEEIEQLANGIRVLGTNPDITTEEIIKEFSEKPVSEEYMEEFKSRYISKDKVLKALGYEENGEEFKRIYKNKGLILSLISTINAECDRLEDIEDKKVELELEFVNAKRDKYWQDKIIDKIKEIGNETQYLLNDRGETKQNYAIRKFYELLEEK